MEIGQAVASGHMLTLTPAALLPLPAGLLTIRKAAVMMVKLRLLSI